MQLHTAKAMMTGGQVVIQHGTKIPAFELNPVA